jgi:hypothetical protein
VPSFSLTFKAAQERITREATNLTRRLRTLMANGAAGGGWRNVRAAVADKIYQAAGLRLASYPNDHRNESRSPILSGLYYFFLDSLPVCNQYPKNVASTFGGEALAAFFRQLFTDWLRV